MGPILTTILVTVLLLYGSVSSNGEGDIVRNIVSPDDSGDDDNVMGKWSKPRTSDQTKIRRFRAEMVEFQRKYEEYLRRLDPGNFNRSTVTFRSIPFFETAYAADIAGGQSDRKQHSSFIHTIPRANLIKSLEGAADEAKTGGSRNPDHLPKESLRGTESSEVATILSPTTDHGPETALVDSIPNSTDPTTLYPQSSPNDYSQNAFLTPFKPIPFRHGMPLVISNFTTHPTVTWPYPPNSSIYSDHYVQMTPPLILEIVTTSVAPKDSPTEDKSNEDIKGRESSNVATSTQNNSIKIIGPLEVDDDIVGTKASSNGIPNNTYMGTMTPFVSQTFPPYHSELHPHVTGLYIRTTDTDEMDKIYPNKSITLSAEALSFHGIDSNLPQTDNSKTTKLSLDKVQGFDLTSSTTPISDAPKIINTTQSKTLAIPTTERVRAVGEVETVTNKYLILPTTKKVAITTVVSSQTPMRPESSPKMPTATATTVTLPKTKNSSSTIIVDRVETEARTTVPKQNGPGRTAKTATSLVTINWGLLLNNDSRSLASLQRVGPAIQVALRRQQVRSLLRLSAKYDDANHDIDVGNNGPPTGVRPYAKDVTDADGYEAAIHHVTGQRLRVVVKQGNSRCSHIYGLTEALRLVINERVIVLFGPVCDYAASNFARLSGRLINVPILSAGTFAHDFGFDKRLPTSEFKHLTRVGPSFDSMARAVVKTLMHFGWHRVTLFLESNSHPEVMGKFCHLASEGILHEFIRRNKNPPTPKGGNGTGDPGIGQGGTSSRTEFMDDSIEEEDEELNYHIIYKQPQKLTEPLSGQISWQEFLKENIGNDNSIIILCASQATVRKILLAAYDLNMVQSGEYVFFNIELFNKPDHKYPIWEVPGETPENNAKARGAYEGLFTLTMRMPDSEEYRKFSDQVKEISKRVYGFDYGPENVNAFVSAFHDAVILYALALNETLQAGFNYTDGVEITRRMWNRTFTGITGNVSIDANGDRYTDYSLWDLNPDTGRFQVVLNYYGKENSLIEVPGSYIHWPGGKSTPPLDQPVCGYDGSLCRKKEFPKYAIIITFLGSLVILLSILSFFIYRRYRFEAELGAMKWKIAWEDLMFESLIKDSRKFQSKWSMGKQSQNGRGWYGGDASSETGSDNIADDDTTGTDDDNLSRRRKKSKKRQRSQISENAFIAHENRQSIKLSRASKSSAGEDVEKPHHHHHNYHENSKRKKSRKMTEVEDEIREMSKIWAGSARVAYYKGAPVVLKPILKKKIEISREMLMEIKHRKDLQNDYITRFIGACVDVPHACLVMEYCQKGSLKDILENDRLQLDWMFRYSLMHDLTKGMTFLHNSEIKSHGNLKSTNCLVDSRFVLKITDFGLNLLRPSEDSHFRGTMDYYKRKLWTAPELLRMENPPPFGTQKSDVYSFAIIMQEIVLRKGTFYIEGHNYNPKEIVQRVKGGYNEVTHQYLRPSLQGAECEEEVTKLIAKCWSEDPMDRMEFNAIRLMIRKINRENESDNILDNLLSRMEHYANNLEDLVEERTADYLEQKRKAEEVLYQLLPKSVAGQLIRGESVTAESFDSVTIYFSDIVGFTSLSASSTPMQVVDLLNDLYTCFDSTIGNYDVYKVETIGDAYMVVSGLPKRNGTQHAREIAGMALALQKAVKSFTIRHRPFEQLILRIGIHSGPCVAGVVGLKMPRYCLFGDTVNTASRMESTGKPNMIHISSTTRDIIEPLGVFKLELRGEVDVKGKGQLTTYWLLGYNSDKDDTSQNKQQMVQTQPQTNPSNDLSLLSTNISSTMPTTRPHFRSDYQIPKQQEDLVSHFLEEPQMRPKRSDNGNSHILRSMASGGSDDKDDIVRCKSTYKTPPSSPILPNVSNKLGLSDISPQPPPTSTDNKRNFLSTPHGPHTSITPRYLPLNLKNVNSSMGILGSTLSLFNNIPSPSQSPTLAKDQNYRESGDKTGFNSDSITAGSNKFFARHNIFPHHPRRRISVETVGRRDKSSESTKITSKPNPLSSFLSNLASHHQYNSSKKRQDKSAQHVALSDMLPHRLSTGAHGVAPMPYINIESSHDDQNLLTFSPPPSYSIKRPSSTTDLSVLFRPPHPSYQADMQSRGSLTSDLLISSLPQQIKYRDEQTNLIENEPLLLDHDEAPHPP